MEKRRSLKERVRALVLDVAPLRHSRQFRLLWIGQAISDLGSGITMVAVPLQVFRITHSSLAVGLVSLSEFVPLLTLSLFAGALADAMDRRRLLLWVFSGLALVSLALAANSWRSPGRLWALYALATVAAALYALYSPAVMSWVPRLVSPEHLASATALDIAYGSMGMLVGPALGGAVIAAIGFAGGYVVDAATFAVAVAMIAAMEPSPAAEDAPRPGLASIREGFGFLKGRRSLQTFMTLEFTTTFLGTPRALFPAFAARLGGGAALVGLLYAAEPAGAFVGNLFTGWIRGVRRPGLGSVLSVLVWAGALVGFGLSRTAWLALSFLAVAGGAEIVRAIFRIVAYQTMVPDALRGRVLGIDQIVITTAPALGNVEAGVIASLTTVPVAIVAGGIATVAATGILAIRNPSFVARSRPEAAGPPA